MKIAKYKHRLCPEDFTLNHNNSLKIQNGQDNIHHPCDGLQAAMTRAIKQFRSFRIVEDTLKKITPCCLNYTLKFDERLRWKNSMFTEGMPCRLMELQFIMQFCKGKVRKWKGPNAG